jgi:hypothetical protein
MIFSNIPAIRCKILKPYREVDSCRLQKNEDGSNDTDTQLQLNCDTRIKAIFMMEK